MKLPRRRFLHLAAGAAALPVVSRFAWAQAVRRGRSGSLFLFRRAGPLTRSVARGPTR